MLTASFSPATLVAFLIERFPSAAARSSTATASTGGGSKSAKRPPLEALAPARKSEVVPVPFPFSCVVTGARLPRPKKHVRVSDAGRWPRHSAAAWTSELLGVAGISCFAGFFSKKRPNTM